MTVKAQGMTCHYTQGKSERTIKGLYTVIAPTNIKFVRESLAFSPFFENQLLTPGFDFEDLDIS
jgi:hypothetical protein